MQVMTQFQEVIFYLACPATRCIKPLNFNKHQKPFLSRVLISFYIHDDVVVSTDVEQRQNEFISPCVKSWAIVHHFRIILLTILQLHGCHFQLRPSTATCFCSSVPVFSKLEQYSYNVHRRSLGVGL